MLKAYKLIEANLFVQNFGDPNQIQSLKEEALWYKANKPEEMAFSNQGCWRSEFKYKDISWLMQGLTEVLNVAIDYYKKSDPTYLEKTKIYMNPEVTYWTNVNEPGSKNVLHNHDLHHFVACYYLQSEDTGNLVFSNPANLMENCHPFSPFVSQMAYPPKTGDLLLWPGWMPHETETNYSDKQRISIAFNIRFKTPRGTFREN